MNRTRHHVLPLAGTTPTLAAQPYRCVPRPSPALSVRLSALLTPNPGAKLVTLRTDARQGVRRARSYPPARQRSYEYIVDVGIAEAQRCQVCGRRFWLQRKPRERVPAAAASLTETEERRRAIKGGFATRKECEAALAKVLAALEPQSFTPPTKATVKQFLTGEWLPTVKGSLRPTTYASYVMLTREHILPRLGALQLQKLSPARSTPSTLSFWRTAACMARAASRPPRCAASTPFCTRPADAVRWGRYHQPGRLRRSAQASGDGQDEAARLERRAAGRLPRRGGSDRLFALWRLLAATGMRRGEALGLSWQDLDMEAGCGDDSPGLDPGERHSPVL